MSFGSSASINVNAVLIDSVASRTAVANAINAIGFSGGSTNLTAAFNAMNTALTGSAEMIDHSYVNLATDGVANSPSSATTARNNLIGTGVGQAGVDNISIEAIGGSVDATFLQNSICYPGPCTISPTFNFPGQGFYIPIASAADFPTAIANKIEVITQVPEPGMGLIFALGMAGLVVLRRKVA